MQESSAPQLSRTMEISSTQKRVYLERIKHRFSRDIENKKNSPVDWQLLTSRLNLRHTQKETNSRLANVYEMQGKLETLENIVACKPDDIGSLVKIDDNRVMESHKRLLHYTRKAWYDIVDELDS